MKYIAISFTLKGQSFDDIKPVLSRISEIEGGAQGNVCLVHGFMPKEAVVARGFDTNVVDTLAYLFPVQMNCYIDGPKREMMAEVIKQNRATVYAIGEIKEGVAEELDLYAKATPFIWRLPLDWDGTMNAVAPMPTKGEMRVRANFNASKLDAVTVAKNSAAQLIDACEDIAQSATATDMKNEVWKSEVCRCAALAQTKYEEAAMYHVKALTA